MMSYFQLILGLQSKGIAYKYAMVQPPKAGHFSSMCSSTIREKMSEGWKDFFFFFVYVQGGKASYVVSCFRPSKLLFSSFSLWLAAPPPSFFSRLPLWIRKWWNLSVFHPLLIHGNVQTKARPPFREQFGEPFTWKNDHDSKAQLPYWLSEHFTNLETMK